MSAFCVRGAPPSKKPREAQPTNYIKMTPDRISLQPVDNLTSLRFYKQVYLDGLKAPLDGMWEYGLIPQAQHLEIFLDGQSIGFVAVNDELVAMQCFIVPEAPLDVATIVKELRSQKVFDQAFAATLDPAFYAACLDIGGSFERHTLLYNYQSRSSEADRSTNLHSFRPISMEEADQTFDFQSTALSLPDAALPWLRGYITDLIEKQHLRVLTDANGTWIGTGEFRVSPTQRDIVDLGVIVSPEWRGQRFATNILKRLVTESIDRHMTPICSTTVDNPSSQKAIERAGFVCDHTIDKVQFD